MCGGPITDTSVSYPLGEYIAKVISASATHAEAAKRLVDVISANKLPITITDNSTVQASMEYLIDAISKEFDALSEADKEGITKSEHIGDEIVDMIVNGAFDEIEPSDVTEDMLKFMSA